MTPGPRRRPPAQATSLSGGTPIDTYPRFVRAALLALCGLALPASTATAATRVVDNGAVECPNAGSFASIQAAVDASEPGDTVVVCPGLYREAAGPMDQNGLTITKPLTLRGAGADLVRIEPAGDIGDVLAPAKTIRDNAGNVIFVQSSAGRVDISGVTVAAGDPDEARGMVYAEAGVVFDRSTGSLSASRITDLVPASTVDFSTDVGFGVVAFADGGTGAFDFDLSGTLVEDYAKGGVLIDARNGASLLGRVRNSVVRGRGPLDGDGQGQNGIQVSRSGARAEITGNLIKDHYFTRDESSSAGVLLYDLSNDNIAASRVEGNDFRANGYGVFNADINGCDEETLVPAKDNWWGHSGGPSPTPTPPDCATTTYAITGPRPFGDRVNPTVDYLPSRPAARGAPAAPARQADAPPVLEIDSPADGAAFEPGSNVTVAATATDDFDVARVEFRRGTTPVDANAEHPFYSATFPAPAAGDSDAITVIATDSAGQTTVRSISLRGNAALPPQDTPRQQPQPADDRPPAVTITGPGEGAAIDPAGAPRITADASDDKGVARVAFLDDGRVVCTDDAAPFDCPYLPSGDDVGRNTLIAIAVDGAGQTGVDFRAVTVSRFAPRLAAKTTPKRDKKRPYRYATSGSLALPAGVSREQACAGGGSVAIEFTAGRLKLPTFATLRADCTFKTSIAFPSRRSLGRGRLIVRTTFPGNGVVGPAKARIQKVRAG